MSAINIDKIVKRDTPSFSKRRIFFAIAPVFLIGLSAFIFKDGGGGVAVNRIVKHDGVNTSLPKAKPQEMLNNKLSAEAKAMLNPDIPQDTSTIPTLTQVKENSKPKIAPVISNDEIVAMKNNVTQQQESILRSNVQYQRTEYLQKQRELDSLKNLYASGGNVVDKKPETKNNDLQATLVTGRPNQILTIGGKQPVNGSNIQSSARTGNYAATILQNTLLQEGATVTLRLDEDMTVNGSSFKKNSLLDGICRNAGTTIKILLPSIPSASVFDVNGKDGIEVSNATKLNDALEQAKDAVGNYLPGAIQNARTAISTLVKKRQSNSLTGMTYVTGGYKVFIVIK
jgi:hypothetical protein